MDQTPREPWCVVAIIRQGRLWTMRVPETVAPHAMENGWLVLIRDSEIPPADTEPSQRNPNRSGECG